MIVRNPKVIARLLAGVFTRPRRIPILHLQYCPLVISRSYSGPSIKDAFKEFERLQQRQPQDKSTPAAGAASDIADDLVAEEEVEEQDDDDAMRREALLEAAASCEEEQNIAEFINDSPVETLYLCINESRAEAAWKSYMETREDPEASKNLTKETLIDLLQMISRHAVNNSETKQRLQIVCNHLRSLVGTIDLNADQGLDADFDVDSDPNDLNSFTISNNNNNDQVNDNNDQNGSSSTPPFTEEEYQIICSALARGRAFDFCLDILQEQVRYLGRADPISFENVIYRMILGRRVQDALQLSSEYRRYNLPSTAGIFSAIIRGFVRIEDLDGAESTLKAKIKAGYSGNSQDYTNLMTGFLQKGDLAAVERWKSQLVELKNFMTADMTALFVFTYSRSNVEMAEQWFTEHVKLDEERKFLRAWNSMLYAYCKHDRIHDAISLLKRMSHEGPTPDEASYYILMDSFIKQDKFHVAKEIFDSMKATGIRPGVFSYSIILNGYVRARDIKAAELVLDDMKLADVAPNVVTYSTLIYGYSKSRNIDLALNLYRYCKETGIQVNNYTCNTLLYGTAVHGIYDSTFEIYRDMENYEIKLDQYTYTALIFGFTRRGDLVSAQKLFSQMLEKRIPIGVHQYNAYLGGLTLKHETKEAYRALAEMRQNKIVPNLATYNILMNLCSQDGRVDNVLKFLHIMIRDEGVEIIDSRTVAHVMRLLAEHEKVEEMKTTFRAFEAAQDDGRLKLDAKAWAAFAEGLAQCREFEESKKVILEMLKNGFVPQEYMMRNTFSLFSQEGMMDDLETIVDLLDRYELERRMFEEPEEVKKSRLGLEAKEFIHHIFKSNKESAI